MKKTNMTFIAIVSVSIMLFLAACGSEGVDSETKDEVNDEADAEYVLEAAQMMTKDDVSALGTEKFADLVKEKSDGKMVIKWHYGSQLGSDIETFEAMKNGNLDMATGSIANLTTITKAFDPFMLPFLFDNEEQALNAARDEEVHDMMNDKMNEHNLQWVGSLDYGGPRVVATTKKLSSLDDMKELKMRTSRSTMEIAAVESFGSKGVTIDWPETPEALSSGMADGLTDTYASVEDANLHEGDLITNMLDVPFQWYFMLVAMNQEKYEELPEDLQQVLNESAQEMEEYFWEEKPEFVNNAIAEMKEEGLEINSLSDEDYKELEEKSKEEVWDKFIGDSFTQEELDVIKKAAGDGGEDGDWGYSIDSE